MKLLIAGSRCIEDLNLSPYIPKETSLIISGGAKGIDSLAEQYADKRGMSKTILKPRYDLYGRAAPLKRNEEMADMCDNALIFWNGKSKGTKHIIDYLNKIGKPAEVVTVDDNGYAEPLYRELTMTEYIKDLCAQRGWTYYKLALESGIPHSSLSSMMNKQEIPSMNNLIKICGGFDISLAEFFLGMEPPSDLVQEFADLWNRLDMKSKHLAITYLYGLVHKEVL